MLDRKLILLLGSVISSVSFAGLVQPNDGYVGEYHVIFLTNDFFASTFMGGVAGANAEISTRANSGSATAGLNYVAMISDSSQDLRDLILDSFPIYNTVGDRVADSFSSFFSPPVDPFSSFFFDSNGTDLVTTSVPLSNFFTGSNIDGTNSGANCNDWTVGGSALVNFGNARNPNTVISNNAGPGFLRCSSQMRLAGISTDTAIAVPEPSQVFCLSVVATLIWLGHSVKKVCCRDPFLVNGTPGRFLRSNCPGKAENEYC